MQLLHFRVPRWHLVTPVEAAKTRWSVYGWSLEPIPPMHVRILRTIVANPQPFLVPSPHPRRFTPLLPFALY